MATIRSYSFKDLLERAAVIAREKRHGYIGVTHLFLASLKLKDSYTGTWIKYLNLSDFVISTGIAEEMPLCREGDYKTPRNTPRVDSLINMFSPETPEKDIIDRVLNGDLNDVSLYFMARETSTERYLNEDREEKALFVDEKDAHAFEHLGRLNDYTRNLTLLAMKGRLAPVIGREEEIGKIRRILLQTKKNSPVLIGEAGVGKTAVAEGFAQYLLDGETNPALKRMKVLELDLTALLSGTKYIGETEKRVQMILKAVENDPNVILFIDEIHRIVGLGRTEGGHNDISNMLKPALARGEMKIIGASTFREYQKSIACDKAMERRFEPVVVREPDEETARLMIRDGLNSVFEKHYGMRIDDDLIAPAIRLVKDYMPLKKLPDSAVSVFDRAFATCRLSGKEKPDIEDIERAVSEMADVSLLLMKRDVKNRFLLMMGSLRSAVFGQDTALGALESSIASVLMRFEDRERPLGVFLFLGPTGTGKTFVAGKIAETLFGSGEKYLQLDMGSFKNENDINRLIGSPPGYVGYENRGELTGFIKSNPNSVVMLDEIEKAHPLITDSLLGLFENGFIRDNHGEIHDGKNIIFILSSNAVIKGITIQGFAISGDKSGDVTSGTAISRTVSTVNIAAPDINEKERQKKSLRDAGFREEFINRMDMILQFDPLTPDALRLIAEREIGALAALVRERGTELAFGDDFMEWLVKNAMDEKLGARPVKRLVRDYITKPVSCLLMEGCRGKIMIERIIKDGAESVEIRMEQEGLG